MTELKISLNDIESVKMGLTILQAIVDGGGKLIASALHTVEEVTGCDINGDGAIGVPDDLIGGGGDDGLGDLFPEDEDVTAGPTIDTVKDAVTALAKAKGREAAKTLITKALQKMKVAKLEEVPVEKYAALIDVLKKAAA